MSNKKKMEVLYFVEQYIKRYGYPPTVRDIGKGFVPHQLCMVIFGN